MDVAGFVEEHPFGAAAIGLGTVLIVWYLVASSGSSQSAAAPQSSDAAAAQLAAAQIAMNGQVAMAGIQATAQTQALASAATAQVGTAQYNALAEIANANSATAQASYAADLGESTNIAAEFSKLADSLNTFSKNQTAIAESTNTVAATAIAANPQNAPGILAQLMGYVSQAYSSASNYWNQSSGVSSSTTNTYTPGSFNVAWWGSGAAATATAAKQSTTTANASSSSTAAGANASNYYLSSAAGAPNALTANAASWLQGFTGLLNAFRLQPMPTLSGAQQLALANINSAAATNAFVNAH